MFGPCFAAAVVRLNVRERLRRARDVVLLHALLMVVRLMVVRARFPRRGSGALGRAWGWVRRTSSRRGSSVGPGRLNAVALRLSPSGPELGEEDDGDDESCLEAVQDVSLRGVHGGVHHTSISRHS
jgi:hypothetical protein